SPERINPGDKKHTVTKILKITSGSTPEIALKVDRLYSSIIKAGTHLASSIKVAEAAKVIENTQRDVNIALINELALIFNAMGINTKDVIEAAATKWNFIKLTPGLVGGHCIGVDPYYLTYKAQELGYTPNLILGARQINNGMSKYVAERVIKLMIKKGLPVYDAKVLVLGLAFKENCPDIRNTKVVDIVNELQDYGCKVDVSDYWADKEEVQKEYNIELIDNYNIEAYDTIVVAVAHDRYKEIEISNENRVVFDIKGILKNSDGSL
ncbi:MAG: nucleotide sugar dehydrogenase, partial [Sulfurovaceae bacterium]